MLDPITINTTNLKTATSALQQMSLVENLQIQTLNNSGDVVTSTNTDNALKNLLQVPIIQAMAANG